MTWNNRHGIKYFDNLILHYGKSKIHVYNNAQKITTLSEESILRLALWVDTIRLRIEKRKRRKK